MPRIIFVILFLFFTLVPFVLVKMAEALLGVENPVEQKTTQTANQTGSGYQGSHYHSHYYGHRPYYGGFFYYGNRGRGGWLGRTYRSSSSSYGGSSFGSSSRSYTGGSSSFKGGSYGSFGK